MSTVIDSTASLLTRVEASKRLGISSRTLYNLTAKGMIPYVQIGRSVKYRDKDIVAFIESRTVYAKSSK